MSKEIAEEYASSLADLTVNSKPLINMLTILAEENIDHAGVIVETVEKHLEKVNPDIKLPVLYLVDSIIKNVGGAYTTKFSQSIVNMFTRTFKQVDEKIRSQMFKLRETWHDVFPATKLYLLDVKVSLIDPAWPVQAQPQQTTIHVNPNFLKKTATTSAAPTPAPVPTPVPDDDEKMRSILAKKEQELLMLQKKKVEMELEQMRRQLELESSSRTNQTRKIEARMRRNTPAADQAAAVSNPTPAGLTVKIAPVVTPKVVPTVMPVAMVNPVVAPPVAAPEVAAIPAKQRLGPPVNKPAGVGRIAPVSGALAAARRDPRLARRAPPAPPIAPHVFDIKPLERVTKRKNVITIDVRPDEPRRERRRDARPRRDPAAPAVTKHKDKKVDDDPASVVDFIDKLLVADPKKINRLPPIPKIVRDEPPDPPAPKRKKEVAREKKKKRDDADGKESSEGSSPEKKVRTKEIKKKPKEPRVEPEPEKADDEVVAFKALKNYHKERYRERNKEKSESPEKPAAALAPPVELASLVPPVAAASLASPVAAASLPAPANVPEIVETKDVDLRVLPAVEPKPAPVAQKRSSTEAVEGKPKKNKIDKFDILFGNEDVDLRQLPQVDELAAPPPPIITESPKKSPRREPKPPVEEEKPSQESPASPEPEPEPDLGSPKKDWHEVKEKKDKEEVKKTPSKLDLAKAKLAEMTRTKDRLGRPLLFSKSPSIEKERRRTLSSSEDTDMREGPEEFDAEDHKKTINIIMSQAKEQFSDGQLDKGQYNALMYQVLQLNEKLKLKEAKQRESLELSKRKLKAHTDEHRAGPRASPPDRNRFGDIDERTLPALAPPDFAPPDLAPPDLDLLPRPPAMPAFGPFPPVPWPRPDDFGRRFRGPAPPFFRATFDKRGPRGFDAPRLPPLPPPQPGVCQGPCPLRRYERARDPPPLGAPGALPPPDFALLDYIDRDPVKTIQIDGVPREIRFYGDVAIVMLDWDDPREIRFLPGCRRVTFDNKDSVVLSFNEGYRRVEIEDQMFDIKFGAPTRELYINERWHECVFGGGPLGVLVDGKPRLVRLEGPLPQVDIGKDKRTDLVAGKINLVVNATHMCPVYLDSKVQKFTVDGHVLTVRFVDALRTVLINERPFKVEFGDLPKPIYIGNEKHFIRFTSLPRGVKPGLVEIADMEGAGLEPAPPAPPPPGPASDVALEASLDPPARPGTTPSPEVAETQGLDMLASVMPTHTALAPGSAYRLAAPAAPAAPAALPGLAPLAPPHIDVTDLFAKLVATGIVQVPPKTEPKVDKTEEVKNKPKEDKSVIHRVDLLKPETLRTKQWGIVSKLYGGMQCSGCGSRFPPEQTVRYSQHLDWHFRQNRRERDSARRAHSRHWHYDLADWLQYEEVTDLDDREKNWFETGGPEEGGAPAEPAAEAPSVAAGAPADASCALCGDKFDQFYNEDHEEWHLRNSVRHEDNNYHPVCFDDYKASLTKEEPPKEPADDVVAADKTEEAIEIKDAEDEDQSDNESVVEVVEEKPPEPLEIDEGEEDDVIYKAEPVEQVVVEDEEDTDDETSARRAARDAAAALDLARVRVKQEPIDPDDEPVITAEEETIAPPMETTQTNHVSVLSSIDGNVQLDSAPTPIAAIPLGGIRINISKTAIPTFVSTPMVDPMLDEFSADDEPLPPGEEPELEYKLKPGLEGVQFSRQPPLSKGNELSGLCSIM